MAENEFAEPSWRDPGEPDDALPPHLSRSGPCAHLRRARAAGLSIPGAVRSDARRYRAPASELVLGRSNTLQAVPMQRDISERAACLHRPAVTPDDHSDFAFDACREDRDRHQFLCLQRIGFAQVFHRRTLAVPIPRAFRDCMDAGDISCGRGSGKAFLRRQGSKIYSTDPLRQMRR